MGVGLRLVFVTTSQNLTALVRADSCEFVDRLLGARKAIHEFTRINTNEGKSADLIFTAIVLRNRPRKLLNVKF